MHFAAESHVDRSILSPEPVIQTNLLGTFRLLEAARLHRVPRFVHVSTDEVYGSLPAPEEATENFPLQPSSPYSASKAGSDMLALSYFVTFRLPVVVTRASNNYGPYQFPEKLIPLMISNALEDRPLPVYGDGMQIRDWLYVDDHCRGILAVLEKGRAGEVYNIGGNRSLPNLEVIHKLLQLTGKPESLIEYVEGPAGTRPALCALERKDPARNRLAAAGGFRNRPRAHHRLVPRQRRVGRPRAQRRVSELLRAQLREPGVGPRGKGGTDDRFLSSVNASRFGEADASVPAAAREEIEMSLDTAGRTACATSVEAALTA